MVSGRAVMPVADVTLRMPSQGRIRLGVKGPKGEPRAIGTFRLTSPDAEAIRQIAGLYGGTPTRWADAPTGEQWQVTTQATELPIVLPPDPLGGTPCYELWSRGGLQRRCDGEVCQITEATADGATLGETPCLCVQADALACKPIVRLAVILREIRFGGTWMIECKGWNGFTELPGMVEVVRSMQGRGIVRAVLAVEARQTKIMGKTKNFVVPVLRLADSADALARGDSALRALGPAEMGAPALCEPTPRTVSERPSEPGWDDDEPTDAELVYEPTAADWGWVDGILRGACSDVFGYDGVDENTEWLLTKLFLAASGRQWTDPLQAILEEWWQNLTVLVRKIEARTLEVVRTDDARLILRVATTSST